MKNNKNSKYYVPASIQKLFVGVISSVFVIQFLFFTREGIVQYLHNPNIGGFYGFYFSLNLVPLLLFITAYSLNPRSLKFIERSFESMLIAISGVIAWSIVSMISPIISLRDGSQSVESYAQYQIVSASLLVLAYGIVLYWLRLAKRWQ